MSDVLKLDPLERKKAGYLTLMTFRPNTIAQQSWGRRLVLPSFHQSWMQHHRQSDTDPSCTKYRSRSLKWKIQEFSPRTYPTSVREGAALQTSKAYPLVQSLQPWCEYNARYCTRNKNKYWQVMQWWWHETNSNIRLGYYGALWGVIKWAAVSLCCPSVCLMPRHNSRTERHRKPTIDRVEGHHRRNQCTYLKVTRSMVKVTWPINAQTANAQYVSKGKAYELQTWVYRWSTKTRIADKQHDL